MTDDPDTDKIGGERWIATRDTLDCPRHGEQRYVTVGDKNFCEVCLADHLHGQSVHNEPVPDTGAPVPDAPAQQPEDPPFEASGASESDPEPEPAAPPAQPDQSASTEDTSG